MIMTIMKKAMMVVVPTSMIIMTMIDNDEVNFSQASSVTSARQMREVLVLMKRTLAG